ncbi:HAD family hydrolase [Nocardiopsis synnemataformans]|uniref:HAD family hydrolase n=1 Tax=Nocardiopsis synnemataformans TaxID=61305 RepID=UPI003EC0B5B6
MLESQPRHRPRYGAFFDVDETLISDKSMFSFLAFYLRERGEPSSVYDRLAGELRGRARQGTPREDVNRAYYRLYRGEARATVAASGRRWFAERVRDPGFLHTRAVDELDRHRAAGADTVLLSGSFFACLDPVAEALGATAALGSEPVVRGGLFTGEVTRTMIGRAKGEAAAEFAASRGLSLPDSHGYGDHISDLALLEAVGHPHVVAGDPDLRAHAVARGWPVLETRSTPRSYGGASSAHVPLRHGDECRCGCALARWSTGTDTHTDPDSAGRPTPTGVR